MPQIVRDILDNPREYMPFLLMVSGLLTFWAILCLFAICSVRAKTRRWKFWLAVGPVLFGAIGVCADIPFSMASGGFAVHLQLKWLFLLPLLVGIYGLLLWFGIRRAKAQRTIETSNIELPTSNSE